MTRKHFEAIARAMRETRPVFATPAFAQWERSLFAIADACAAFNDGFNRARFLRACSKEE